MRKEKHAYLIIAHNNFNQLKTLLRLLDDSRNDLYLHIGKDIKNVDFSQFSSVCSHSKLYFATKRITTYWGSKAQVDAILLLLKQAINTSDYTYYHLLSGVDLPIKTQDYIHNFFEENKGLNYISFDLKCLSDKCYYESTVSRIRYYHMFSFLFLFRKYKYPFLRKISSVGYYLDQMSIMIQRLLRVDRVKKLDIDVYKGDGWFSITQDFAKYLLEVEPQINKFIKYSFCADEIFIQTIIMNSSFRDTLENGVNSRSMRHIDWKRGAPYTFKKSDLEELLQSNDLFARKFDEKIDTNIINDISNHLLH